MSEEETEKTEADERKPETIACPRCAVELTGKSPLSLLMMVTAACWRRLRCADGVMRFHCRACAEALEPTPKEVTQTSMTELIDSGAIGTAIGGRSDRPGSALIDYAAGARAADTAAIISVDRNGNESVVEVFDLSDDLGGNP